MNRLLDDDSIKTKEDLEEAATKCIINTMMGIHFTKEQADRIKRMLDMLTIK